MSASSLSDEPLNPSPDVIVQLMERIISERWPSELDHLSNYFARLDCELSPASEPDDETPRGVTQGQFIMPGVAVENGSWAALNEELFSLNLFAYGGVHGSSAANVDAGYDAVRDGISAVFGPSPDESTDQRGNRSAIWSAQETGISLYAHVTLAPVLQLGASHEGRTAVYHQLIAQIPDRPRY